MLPFATVFPSTLHGWRPRLLRDGPRFIAIRTGFAHQRPLCTHKYLRFYGTPRNAVKIEALSRQIALPMPRVSGASESDIEPTAPLRVYSVFDSSEYPRWPLSAPLETRPLWWSINARAIVVFNAHPAKTAPYLRFATMVFGLHDVFPKSRMPALLRLGLCWRAFDALNTPVLSGVGAAGIRKQLVEKTVSFTTMCREKIPYQCLWNSPQGLIGQPQAAALSRAMAAFIFSKRELSIREVAACMSTKMLAEKMGVNVHDIDAMFVDYCNDNMFNGIY